MGEECLIDKVMYITENEDGLLSVCYNNQQGKIKYKLETEAVVIENNGKIILLNNNDLYTPSKKYIFLGALNGHTNEIDSFIFHVKDPVSQKIGLLDKDGNIIVPVEYDSILLDDLHRAFKTLVAIVEKNGLYGLYGYLKEFKGFLLPIKYKSIKHLEIADTSERFKPYNLYVYMENDKYGLFNVEKGVVLPAIYDSIGSVIRKDDKCGIIDHNGKIIIPLIYDAFTSFHYDYESGQEIYVMRILNTDYSIDKNNNILEECEHYNFRKQDKYEKSPNRLIEDIELKVIT